MHLQMILYTSSWGQARLSDSLILSQCPWSVLVSVASSSYVDLLFHEEFTAASHTAMVMGPGLRTNEIFLSWNFY